MTKLFVVGTAVLLFVGLVGGAMLYLFEDQIMPQPSPAGPPSSAPQDISSFEDCAAAGNAVMESYPRQCNTVDGKHFVEDIGNELEKTDLIRVSNPRPNQTITSPMHVTGEARGFWFFEASFPVRLLDEQGNEIPLTPPYIMATQEWMTENFVPFEATLEFRARAGQKGTLVFQKDNPSGLPENEDELRMPVVFGEFGGNGANNGCIITGCSDQVCAEEETITTCEFRAEYACYQNAVCERQIGGECGWTQTPQLEQCLAQAEETGSEALPQ